MRDSVLGSRPEPKSPNRLSLLGSLKQILIFITVFVFKFLIQPSIRHSFFKWPMAEYLDGTIQDGKACKECIFIENFLPVGQNTSSSIPPFFFEKLVSQLVQNVYLDSQQVPECAGLFLALLYLGLDIIF